MSEVRHKRMGFHNDDSAACNKNTWVTVAIMVPSGIKEGTLVAL